MYIKKVVLTNIRCFKDLEIDLTSGTGVKKWLMVFGNNGVGKTTILRSIAIGLCDETSAAGLISELKGEMVRYECDQGTIRIELVDPQSKKVFFIETTIKAEIFSPSSESEIEKDMSNDFPWDKLFLCGYGAGRAIFGSDSADKHKTIDAVYTLFNYESSLQNLEIPLYRLSHAEGESVVENILRRIEVVLDLPSDAIRLDKSGISIQGPWGRFIPVGNLADGYAATLAWITDMIGWGMLFQKSSFSVDLPGIVLVDEIEQHLHPSWQKKIISALHSQFPAVQFIATSHAPMCAIGTANCDNADEVCSLISLGREKDHVKAVDRISPPRGKRADQVLTSDLFDLDTTRSNDSEQRIKRYSQLLSKSSRTGQEESELRRLHSELEKELGSDETPLQEMVGQAVRDALDKLVAKIAKDKKPPKKAMDFEIRRQLNELFGKGSYDKN